MGFGSYVYTTIRYESEGHHHGHSHPHRGHLTNYATGLAWSWDFGNSSSEVSRCDLRKESYPQHSCFSRNATKGGSYTVGENFLVDSYKEKYNKTNFEEELETTVESGKPNLLVSQYVRGKRTDKYHEEERFRDHLQFFNLKEDAIASSVFAVPSECPL